ncbi:MAG: GNAT family N-acyltransferase, partial [Gammaproteobacteria bacterium]
MDRDLDLLTHFRKYFEILRADTPDLLEEAFRLRYEVYCGEGCLPGFDPLDYPDGLERDIYDYEHRSVHCLLRHRSTGSNAGTVRLVLADPVQPDAPFPIEVAAG